MLIFFSKKNTVFFYNLKKIEYLYKKKIIKNEHERNKQKY